jgi:elongation factor Ts
MAEISAAMVKELREMTGNGMMECKKALSETAGDMKAAIDLLRVRSGAKANKAADRIAAEGAVSAFIAADGKTGALVEVNCETDFVAKNEDFTGFGKELARIVTETNPADVDALAVAKLASGETVEEKRKALVMKLGENISVRRFKRFATHNRLVSYLHGVKIGVMVDYSGDETVGKDVAMHIAASKPICVSHDQVPAEKIAHEREIYTAQAAESGKPANIVEKMVEGRVQKFLAEVALLGQPFVKNPDETVDKMLKSKSTKIDGFQMFIVGEGIEKKVTDFAAEVAAQTAAAKKDNPGSASVTA